MGIIYVLLPLAVLISGVGLFGFIWGVKTKQFDDLQSPAVRILFDEEEKK
jgi:cbb3-type cytochrome oxidase maturation protein